MKPESNQTKNNFQNHTFKNFESTVNDIKNNQNNIFIFKQNKSLFKNIPKHIFIYLLQKIRYNTLIKCKQVIDICFK